MNKFFLSVLITLAGFSPACTVLNQSETGCGDAQTGCACVVALPEPPEGGLNAAEQADLLALWSEEKLAFDVYTELGKTYPMRMFTHIPQAESRHRAAVATLAKRYGLAEASEDALAQGEFRDESVSRLYEQLVARGRSSRIEAMRVGCQIEELDIADLRSAASRTDRSDLRAVYANLEKASGNHLRAFDRQLKRAGGTYSPRHLSEEDYNAILAGHHGGSVSAAADHAAQVEAMAKGYESKWPQVPQFTAEDLMSMPRGERPVLIDVRNASERAVSLIPSALTLETFGGDASESTARPVIVYCTIGYRSTKLAAKLRRRGFNAHNLHCGVLAWAHAGGVFVTSEGQATSQVHVYGRRWDLLPIGYQSHY